MGERAGDSVRERMGKGGEGRVREGYREWDGTENWESLSVRGLGAGGMERGCNRMGMRGRLSEDEAGEKARP